MQGIDTNILVRVIIDDDNEQQSEIAKHALAAIKQIYITDIVLVETVWVLKSCYHFSKNKIVNIIEVLLENEAIVFENTALIYQALTIFTENNIDFSDCIILTKTNHKKTTLLTFDKKLSKIPGATLLQQEITT